MFKKEFGDLDEAKLKVEHKGRETNSTQRAINIVPMIRKAFLFIKRNGFHSIVEKGLNFSNAVLWIRKYDLASIKAEEELFKKEVEDLTPYCKLKPIQVNPEFICSDSFVAEIKELNPYFLLTMENPPYRKALLEAIRGVALNQCAGYLPVFKGDSATVWALYYRHINHIGSTIHIATNYADEVLILRRSNPCIFPQDNINKIFARVFAVGTELMIETIEEIIKSKNVKTFKQPRTMGKTCSSNDFFNSHILTSLRRDFKAGWLRKDLSRLRTF